MRFARWGGSRHRTAGSWAALLGVLAIVALALAAAYAWWQGQQLARPYALAGWQGTFWGLAAALGLPLFLGVRRTSIGEREWQREDSLRTLVDSISVGVAVIEGPDSRLAFANPVYQRILGGAPESALGRPLRDVLPAETAEITESYIAEAYRTGRPVRAYEIAVGMGEPAGTSYWDVEYTPLRREEGGAPAMLMLAMPASERVRAHREEEALAAQAQQRVAQLQAVLSAISDAVLVVDAEQNPIFVNDRVAHWLGGPPTPEMLRRMGNLVRQAEIYWPDGRLMEPAEHHLPRALRGEVIVGEEVMFRPPQRGPLRWARVSAAPVREEGRITGAVVTGGDITAQKETQAERERLLAEVQSTRENLRAIIDRIPDGVMVVDTSQRVVMSNETTRRYLGHDVAGMALPDLRRIHEVVMTDGRPFPPGQTAVERALRGEAVAGLEIRMLHLDGHVIDALESTAPLRDAEGRITGAVVALADITARKEAEREREELLVEIQRARANLYTIIDRLPDWVVVLDTSLRVTLANAAARRDARRAAVGMTAAELRSVHKLTDAEGRPFPAGQTPAERALRGEVVTGVEGRVRLADGSIVTVLESAAPLYDSEGRLYGVAVVTTDITARKQVEAERERLLREVQRAREDLGTLVDSLPDWVLVLDESRHVTLSNEALRRESGRDLAGMTMEEVWRTFDFMAADGRPFPPGQSPAERALRGETVLGAEIRAHMPDDTIRYAIENAAPLYDSDGHLYGAVVVQTDITNQKRVQAELQAARMHLQTVVDRLPDWVLVLDREMRVTLSSQAIRQQAGRELAGMTIEDLWHGYAYTQADGRPFPPGQSPGERAMRGETATNVETRIRLPDGSLANALESAAPLYDPDGRVYGIVVVLTDITALRQAEAERERLLAEVQAAHENLRIILDRVPDGVMVVDAAQRVLLSNETNRRYVGRDVTGLTLADLRDVYGFVMADGRPFPPGEAPIDRALHGETVAGVEARLLRINGYAIDALESAAPLYDGQGRISGAVVALTDITALRQAEAEVRRAQQYLQTIVNRLPDGVAVIDSTLRVTLVNEASRQLLGRDITGASLAELDQGFRMLSPEGTPLPAQERPVQRLQRGEPVSGTELRIERPDGSAVDLLLGATPIYDHELTAAIITLTDITARKEAERDRERLLAEIQRARADLYRIIDRLPDWVLVLDTSLRVRLANAAIRRDAGREVVGMTAAELWSAYEFTDAEGRPFPPGQTPAERALRGEAVANVEGHVRRPDGSISNSLESAAPLYDSEGRLYGVVAVLTDITARKQAEAERERLLAEVQSTREQLQTTLNQLPDVVFAFDRDWRVTLANNAARDYLGRDPTGELLADLLGGVTMELPDGRPVPPQETPLPHALAGETVTGVEIGARLPDGRRIAALVSAAPLYGPEGGATTPPIGAVVTAIDITARKQGEADRERLLGEVQAARRNLETVLDRLPDGVIVADAALRITLANAGARQYLGSDIVGRPVAEVVQRIRFETPGGEPIAEDQWPMQRAMRGEPVAGLELRAVLPDGRALALLASAVALRDGQGRPIGAVLAVTDITTQKEAQAERERLLAEVEEARRNLQTTLDWLPAGVVAIDTDLQVVLTNNLIRQYLGGDLAGASIFDVVDEYGLTMPDGQPFPLDEHSPIRRAQEGEVLTNLEALAHLPDGRRIDLLASVAPTRGPDGAITGVVIAMLDVTVERQAQSERERLLAEVETGRANLQAIVNRLPDGVLVVDQSLHVTLCNDAIRARIGRDVTGEPVQRLWLELHFTAGDGRPFPPGETPVERALRGEVVAGVEVSSQFPGEKRVDALDSAAPLYNPDGSVREVAMVFTDITPLKELDRAKDQFISVAAHELRTPLTALKGHAQILLRRAERGRWAEPDRQSLHTIDDQVDRLNDLIGRLLDVSRIRLGRLKLSREPTDLVALANQAARELQVTTDRHRISVQAEVPRLVGNWDPAALRQVLNNLIGNAIRYADPGPIDVRIRREDGRAVVSVTDYGPGIPPERQARLFEAFRPGAAEEYRKAGGLGLGLYITRGIVEAHGGRIWVQSQVGVGTTFTFSLPLDGRPS